MEFGCQVIGSPTPEITWLFNGQEIEGKGQYAFMQRDELQVLEVQQAVPANTGVFEVVAKNPFGEVSCSANLEVQGKNPNFFKHLFIFRGIKYTIALQRLNQMQCSQKVSGVATVFTIVISILDVLKFR